MTRAELRRAHDELELERRRWALAFWKVRGCLALVALATLTVALVVALAQGEIEPARLAGLLPR